MANDVDVPASLTAFVYEGGIRRATRELFDLSDKRVLEGLDWREIKRFYRAQMAARQCVSEWAIFATDAWELIWGGLLDHWIALTPDEQIGNPDYDASLSLASLTEPDDGSLWFGRVFRRGSRVFYAAICAFPAAGLKIKVSCESGSKSIKFTEIAEGPDDTGNWAPSVVVPLDVSPTDLQALRTVAQRAVEIADREITSKPHREK